MPAQRSHPQNTAATARGIYEGNIGTLALTVLNENTDDLPGYAGDGIDDAWQVQGLRI